MIGPFLYMYLCGVEVPFARSGFGFADRRTIVATQESAAIFLEYVVNTIVSELLHRDELDPKVRNIQNFS